MKQFYKTGLSLVTAIGLSLTALVGCGKTQAPATPETPTPSPSESSTTTTTTTTSTTPTVDENSMRSFTDSAGRSVEIPAKLSSVAPSGSLAQLVLYTAFPDRLAGLAKRFGKSQLAFFPEKYHNLPEFGQFYGKNTSLNMEALLAAAPQVIIDIGEAKKTVKEDMDKLQADLNIPCVFIEARLPEMDKAYEKLAELFGEKGKTDELAAYCKAAIDQANTVRAGLKEEDKVPVYWAMGDEGLNTNAEESFQSEVLQIVGADNVAKLEPVSRGGGTEVSFEQLLQWKPKYVLVDNPGLKETIEEDENWQEFLSETGAQMILVPGRPYGVLASPPSVNRVLGIYWLGQTLYPQQFKRDLKKDFKDFYKLFYDAELSEAQLGELLGD